MKSYYLPINTLTGIELWFVFFLDWLPAKARNPSLSRYLTHSIRGENRWTHAFPKSICAKVTITIGIRNGFADYSFRIHKCYTIRTSTQVMDIQECLICVRLLSHLVTGLEFWTLFNPREQSVPFPFSIFKGYFISLIFTWLIYIYDACLFFY